MIFGIKKCKNCEKVPLNNFNEFVLMRENDRIKLHIRYICFIMAGTIIWLIASGTSKNSEFVNWISFSSTITSIILSVLAIIMSITGETKSEAARNQLEETSRKIEKAVNSMRNINTSTEENMTKLRGNIDILRVKIDDMDVHIQEFTKESNVKMENNFNRTTKWRTAKNE